MRNLWGFELKQSCGNCRFIGLANPPGDELFCCRYPPNPSATSHAVPKTDKGFWCGEWAPRFMEGELGPKEQ